MKKERERFAGKVIALLLPVLLVGLMLALVPASALLPTDNTSTRAITFHKYLIDGEFESPGSADGTELDSTAEAALVEAGATPLDGIKFDIVKAYTAEERQDLIDEGTNVAGDFTKIAGYDFWYLTAATPTTVTTGTDGSITYTIGTGRAFDGVYYVTEQPDGRVAAPAAPFLVSVPLEDPNYVEGQSNGDGWLYNVHVYPKNSDLMFTKTFDDDTRVRSYRDGDIITWKLETTIPADILSAQVYKITDELLPEFFCNGVNSDLDLQVYIDGDDVIPLYLTSSNYTAAWDSTGRELSVTFYDEAVSGGVDGRTVLGSNIGRTLVITFKTRLDLPLNTESGTKTNTATLIYKNNDATESRPSNEVTVKYAAVSISKFKSGTTGPSTVYLEGAKFQIATSKAYAEAGYFLKHDANGGIVDYTDPGYSTATNWVVTTDSSGLAVFGGLNYALDEYEADPLMHQDTIYWLVEVEAPSGYNLLKSAVPVTIPADVQSAGVSIGIANSSGWELPLTGDVGVKIFTILGVVLMSGSVVLLLILKKKRDAYDY